MLTTRSTGINPVAIRIAPSIDVMNQAILRADRGTGAARTADVGDWNSRMTGSVRSSWAPLGLIALGERRGNSSMARALIVEVAVLLRP